MGQLLATSSLGGYLTNNFLTKKVRVLSQPMMRFRQMTRPEPAVGLHQGSILYYDIFSNVATAGGTLNETSTIPRTQLTLSQGSLTIVEYGNSIDYTRKLDLLGDIPIDENIRTGLINDAAKVLDSAAAVQYQASDYKATCETTASTVFASAGVAGTAAGANMSDRNVRDIVDRMLTLNIPKYDGVNYACIGSVNAIRGLYDFFEPMVSQTDMRPLANGEVGTYYMTRFLRETNILSNTLGTYYGEAVFFGDDAVREGIAVEVEIRAKMGDNDYGRDRGLAWYYVGGFQIVYDYSTHGETRVIHVTST